MTAADLKSDIYIYTKRVHSGWDHPKEIAQSTAIDSERLCQI